MTCCEKLKNLDGEYSIVRGFSYLTVADRLLSEDGGSSGDCSAFRERQRADTQPQETYNGGPNAGLERRRTGKLARDPPSV